ncbi:MAG: 3-dehydroquinate synthase [Propionibacteriaceae bacterium]|jgi:3-dehydroquinate synthase|nr:3-dehydroquinate synthase [Propionibacteriaceae bacterium]
MNAWTPIDVNSGNFYQVVIGRDTFSLVPSLFDGVDRVAVIFPPKLRPYLGELISAIPSQVLEIPVPDAESAKTPQVLAHCWNQLAEAGFTRSDAIFGVGGGATTDLAGFVAATWLRGVRYVAMPTTVLGMVDAAVGGKTGINLPMGKNLVGAFYEPYSVLADMSWLETLPSRELRSGFAEVLKVGFISDTTILDDFEANPNVIYQTDEGMAQMIRKAVAVKAQIVSEDFRELGGFSKKEIGREALNYGHTLAHAIEAHEHFTLRHGEAVAIGMVFAAEVAFRMGMIDAGLLARHRKVLEFAGLPITYSGASYDELRTTMSLDKKTRGTTLRLVLLDGLANPVIVQGLDEGLLREAFAALQE